MLKYEKIPKNTFGAQDVIHFATGDIILTPIYTVTENGTKVKYIDTNGAKYYVRKNCVDYEIILSKKEIEYCIKQVEKNIKEKIKIQNKIAELFE